MKSRQVLSLLAGLCLLPSLAFAGEVDFGQTLKGMDGKPLVQSKDVPYTTLGDFVAQALLTQLPAETPPPSAQEKAKRYVLAIKVEKGGKIDLDADQVKMIKDVVGFAFSPLIVGQIWLIVDPASVK